MSVFGIRKRIKSGVKKALGMEDGPSDTAAPNWQNRPPTRQTATAAAEAALENETEVPEPQMAGASESPDEALVEALEPEKEAVSTEDPVAAEEAPAAKTAIEDESTKTDQVVSSISNDDVVGPPLTLEAVQEILDDMVRPALQGDGGDIALLKIEDNDIYVKLVGACTTCPSSIMTMKMGVEALLKEEFPSMRELIQVES
jgi:Fe-S cluster biogenesis protein NfuA